MASSTHDRASASSSRVTVSGIMTSTLGLPPAATRSAAASIRARTCMAYSPGLTTPSRTPRVPSMGLNSCQAWAASSSFSSSADSPEVAFLISQLLGRGQELVQRRVEQAHGDRQPVHGLEDRHEVLLLGLPQLLEGGGLLCRRSSARIMRRTIGRRSSPRNMCSVRHSPMPSAPNRRALAASGPLSALARTASWPLRILSAHPRMVSNSAGASACAELRPRPSTTRPVVPSMEMMSPSFTVTPADGERPSR